MLNSIVRLLPKKQLSRFVGAFVHLQLPQPLRVLSIRLFASYYRIRIDEAEMPIDSYRSIGDFFVRRLKSGLRPLGASRLVHPADSVITQKGELSSGTLLQAKGKTYRLNDFLGEISSDRYLGGAFATYYLCPTDYHRVHSPIRGAIGRVLWIPGELWPVNSWSTQNIDQLFSINERVVIEILTDEGPLAFVMVGATNVGQMSLSFWPDFRTNCANQNKPLLQDFKGQIQITKGQELGAFHMGSTVVLCLTESVAKDDWLSALVLNKQVQVCAASTSALGD